MKINVPISPSVIPSDTRETIYSILRLLNTPLTSVSVHVHDGQPPSVSKLTAGRSLILVPPQATYDEIVHEAVHAALHWAGVEFSTEQEERLVELVCSALFVDPSALVAKRRHFASYLIDWLADFVSRPFSKVGDHASSPKPETSHQSEPQ